MKGFTAFSNRRGRTLAPIACVVLLAGCVATKSDVQLMRSDINTLQSKQDSLYRESIRQMSEQADSMRMLTELLRTTRGQLANAIRDIREMVTTLQEATGQTMQGLRQLQEKTNQPPPQQAAPQPTSTTGNAQTPEDLYRLGANKLAEGSAGAARAVFQEFLSTYPQDEHAADAQFGLAETYVLDQDQAAAVENFARVAEAYPTSSRAPEALYRAGQISEQRNKKADARRYYQTITSRYASSPTARLAKTRLDQLR